MRISDWSSDVCSSDLRPGERGAPPGHRRAPIRGRQLEGGLDDAGGRWMHARDHLVAAAVIAGALVLCGAAPAWADGGGDAWTDDNEIGAEATGTGTREGGSGSGSAQSPCTYSVLHTRMSDIAADKAVAEHRPPRGAEIGRAHV